MFYCTLERVTIVPPQGRYDAKFLQSLLRTFDDGLDDALAVSALAGLGGLEGLDGLIELEAVWYVPCQQSSNEVTSGAHR